MFRTELKPVSRALRWWRGRTRAALAALAALVLLEALAPVRVTRDAALALPAPPQDVAHALADFAALARLDPDIGAWSIEEESGNYTSWRYAVSFACGARCAGRARVVASAQHAGRAQHAPAAAHQVDVEYSVCTSLPLLHWPEFCEEWGSVSTVSAGARGAALRQRWWRRCGAPSAALGRCGAALDAAKDAHLAHITRIYKAA